MSLTLPPTFVIPAPPLAWDGAGGRGGESGLLQLRMKTLARLLGKDVPDKFWMVVIAIVFDEKDPPKSYLFPWKQSVKISVLIFMNLFQATWGVWFLPPLFQNNNNSNKKTNSGLPSLAPLTQGSSLFLMLLSFFPVEW